jgi:hypothetical protein
MSSGFNTDVQVGAETYHVQTEDRGPNHAVIDTAVYQNGRVLHRRTSNYEQFATSESFSAEGLRLRVEEQHRAVIDELRAGALDAEIAAAAEQAIRAAGIEVRLVNLGTWLSGGRVSLDVEVLRRGDRQPAPGALVVAILEGALEEIRHPGRSDAQGRVRIQFALPPLGKRELALVIHARTDIGDDEIRFTMRSRARTPPAGSAP